MLTGFICGVCFYLFLAKRNNLTIIALVFVKPLRKVRQVDSLNDNLLERIGKVKKRIEQFQGTYSKFIRDIEKDIELIEIAINSSCSISGENTHEVAQNTVTYDDIETILRKSNVFVMGYHQETEADEVYTSLASFIGDRFFNLQDLIHKMVISLKKLTVFDNGYVNVPQKSLLILLSFAQGYTI